MPLITQSRHHKDWEGLFAAARTYQLPRSARRQSRLVFKGRKYGFATSLRLQHEENSVA